MKIGLQKGNGNFFEEWKLYCEKKQLPFKVVDVYANDALQQLSDCDLFMWHHHHLNPKDTLFAKQLLIALELRGIKVFPDFYSNWHFDDKLGQKYLFESTGVKHVPTYVFYDKKSALNWLDTTSYPKVFKLRKGAGSRNVWLVKSKAEARNAIKRAFGKGWRQYDPIRGLQESVRKVRISKSSYLPVLKAVAHIFYPLGIENSQGREKGYALLQDFIPDNTFDIRVVVIGDKCFAVKRNVREGDFRASGSGIIEYEKHHFSDELVQISFENAKKIKSQCAAFDFVFLDGVPLVVEVSYGFSKKAYFNCPGYWTSDLTWHEGEFNPYGWMIDDLISKKHSDQA